MNLIGTLVAIIGIIVLGFYINLYVGFFLIIWTIASITWLISNLGRKTEPGRWYDWPLSPPSAVIAYIFSIVDKFVRNYEKK